MLINSASGRLQQSGSLRITLSLGQAISMLMYGNRELTAFLAIHEAVNPHLSIGVTGNLPDRSVPHVSARKAGASGSSTIEQIAARSAGLHEHVRREVGLILASAKERSIAEVFVGALEATGWLGRSVEDIARDAGCGRSEAEAVLTKIQRIDPPGLFARSLAECLRLQAEDAEVLTRELSCLLDNLPMLARGEFDGLARICGCDRKAIAAHFATIRSFNPKPGFVFGQDEIGAAAPDLIVVIGDDGIEVDLNRSTLPTVTVSEAAGGTGADRRMFDAAKAVARAVERRNASTLQIAAEIVRRQAGFLRAGASALRPLMLRDVAEAVGLHESTVSRVTAGLRIDTPRGPMGLRDFFSGALPADGAPVSVAAVRERLRVIVAGEDPARPATDAEIAARLSGAGIRIARRTVAKYRKELRIPGSAARRRAAGSRCP